MDTRATSAAAALILIVGYLAIGMMTGFRITRFLGFDPLVVTLVIAGTGAVIVILWGKVSLTK